MRHLIAFAVATTLFVAPAALAQSAAQSAKPNSSADQGMSMQGQTPKSASGDTMAKPAKKAHHRMARNESRQNASEAEVTKQLNQEQANMAKSGSDTP